jgi:hypothetical protein
MFSAILLATTLLGSETAIVEKDDRFELTLGREFAPLSTVFPHVPYPVKQLTFTVTKSECRNLFACGTTEEVEILETHITEQVVRRHAVVSLSFAPAADGGASLKVRLKDRELSQAYGAGDVRNDR